MWALGLVSLVFGSAEGLVRLDPLVHAPAGLIRGLRADDGEYDMFLGIPYAQVDEENPFGAATLLPKFATPFDAFNDSAICPQLDDVTNTIAGTLDCLRLHVYAPTTASSRSTLPVLAWIHGGGLYTGSANRYLYGPKYLVRHDVIMVAFNYRVGAYGFLCLDTPAISGNQGLKDQGLALRWIKENIAAFGGDVNSITIMGESAGAGSVEYHLLSNQEKLFNQAILQSGTTFMPRRLQSSGRSNALRIARQLGFESEDIPEVAAFLAKTDVKLVTAAVIDLGFLLWPCLEQKFEGVESFLTEHDIDKAIPKVKNMPMIAGFNSREQLGRFASKSADEFKNTNIFEDALQNIYIYDEEFNLMEDIVRRFYIGDEETSEELRITLTDFSSDLNYAFPIQNSVRKYFRNGAKVYHYVFSYDSKRNFVKKEQNITLPGATHADEISYLFDLSYDKEPMADADRRMIDRMTEMWTNFVKYGEPTPEISELLPVKWSPITEDTFAYLDIDSELTVGGRPYHDRMTFWELFYLANKNKLNLFSKF